MKEVHATASRAIRAEPDVVYKILADYRVGHPAILPKRAFLSLDVDEGGVGAGTEFLLRMKSFGTIREMRAKVTEPKPGRVLVETYESREGIQTTFEVRPAESGSGSVVTIQTRWTARGLRGWIEAMLAPPFLRKLYLEELGNLARAAEGPMNTQTRRVEG
jgi:polyketide cyclase/dehydrase/lipid transport protein